MKSITAKIFTSRYTYMLIVGVIINVIVHTLNPEGNMGKAEQYSVFLSILLTFLIWEGNLLLDKQFAKLFPWTSKPLMRVIVQGLINIIYTAALIYLAMTLYNYIFCMVPNASQEKFLSLSIIIGILVSLLLLTVEFGKQFFVEWKASLIEMERYKKESIEAQLELLKGQINPHFLFNNLSVLSSVVYIDQDKAVEFINQFAKVYRYVLECNNKELTTLQDELDFINSYIFLLKIRFGNNINIEINIDRQYLSSLLPPMALELLIENTIKHNEVSSGRPLQVTIHTQLEKYLTVMNTLQARSQAENGTGLGLNNIRKRYSHYTQLPVMVKRKDQKFIVQIPLLKKS
jgi:hypothetical protein